MLELHYGWIAFFVFLAITVLIATKMPVAICFMTIGLFGFTFMLGKPALIELGPTIWSMLDSFPLTSVILFILMGEFMMQGGLSRELYNTTEKWVYRLPGGLAQVNIVACTIFAAISGSSVSTAATMGVLAGPEMEKRGYDNRLTYGSLAAGATLGILIPPSTVMVIYGILTEQSIATLFVAAILPGLLLTALFLLTIYLLAVYRPELGPRGPRFSLRELGGLLALFLLVIGGLYTGWFTPTEAAGVGAGGAMAVTLLKRRLTGAALRASLQETTLSTAMIFLVLIGANIFGYFLAVSQVPEQVIAGATTFGVNRFAVLGIIVLVYILLGCLMEGLAMMVITLPVVFPVIIQLGFNPIWFGVVLTVLLEMSLITPPVGMNVFVLSGVAPGVRMSAIFQGILPFFLTMLLCLFLLILWPQIALFLPGTMAD